MQSRCYAYLPVNIHAIKAQVFHQINNRRGKLLPSLLSAGRSHKVRGVGPATDGQKRLQVAILLLQQVELLQTAIHVVSAFIPRVIRVVFLKVGIGIAEIHLSSIADVGKGIQHMGQLSGVDILRLEVAAVDGLRRVRTAVSSLVCVVFGRLTQFTKYATFLNPEPAAVGLGTF